MQGIVRKHYSKEMYVLCSENSRVHRFLHENLQHLDIQTVLLAVSYIFGKNPHYESDLKALNHCQRICIRNKHSGQCEFMSVFCAVPVNVVEQLVKNASSCSIHIPAGVGLPKTASLEDNAVS